MREGRTPSDFSLRKPALSASRVVLILQTKSISYGFGRPLVGQHRLLKSSEIHFFDTLKRKGVTAFPSKILFAPYPRNSRAQELRTESVGAT